MKRRLVRTAGLLALGGVLLAAGGGEWTARELLHSRIAHAAPALGPDLSVTAGGNAPVAWDLATGHLPSLDLSTDDATRGSLGPFSVHAHLDDVHFSGHTATVASTHVELDIPLAAITSALQSAAPTVPIGALTPDPSHGTLDVALGAAGLGELQLKPELRDGRVTVTPVSLTILGSPASPDRLTALSTRLNASASKAGYPLGVKATAIRLGPDGLAVTLVGGPSRLTNN